MHMADALISPAVGATMWAVSAGLIVHSARRVRAALDDRRVPLMGVLGAFVFAAQMINFAIPGAGSSGHLGGGLILAILLGPHAGFLTIASILTVQALFFADGGLLALGCNIFNLGFFPCFIAYPFIYRRLAGNTRARQAFAAVVCAVLGLQLGALGVVLETAGSGVSALPWRTFLLLMLPIHLAIGIVEGMVTAAVIGFIRQARPEVLALAEARPVGRFPLRGVLASLALATLFMAGGLSWFASAHPDGLEWAMARTTGTTKLAAPASPVYPALEHVQQRTALFPDYDFSQSEAAAPAASPARLGTSLAGVAGAALTLALVALSSVLLRWRRPSTTP